MESWLRNYSHYKFPNKEIGNDAMSLILQILESLRLHLQNVNINEWMRSKMDSDLREILQDRIYWAGLGSEIEQILKDMAFNMVDVGYNESKSNILDEYNVLKGIDESSLWKPLKTHIPIFPLEAGYNNKYTISLENYYDIMGETTIQFEDALTGVIDYINNYYKPNVEEVALQSFVNTVVTLIIQRARQLKPIGQLTFKDLMIAVYNNPAIANVPWKEIFLKPLNQ